MLSITRKIEWVEQLMLGTDTMIHLGYKLVRCHLTWYAAKALCEELGSTLAHVLSTAQFAEIRDVLNGLNIRYATNNLYATQFYVS